MVNAAAPEGLEEPLKSFFLAHRDYLAEHAVDPDLWRTTDEIEQYNHYLDADALAPYPFDSIPRDEAAVARRFGPDAWKQGRGPWRVAEMAARLREAFAAGDWRAALDLAAALGHYLSDLHVPLHSAQNYNGQLTGQDGIHHRWERDLVERHLHQLEGSFAPDSAERIDDTVGLAFEVLQESYREVAPLLAQDLELRGPTDYLETAADDRYSDRYYSALYLRQEPVIRRRLQQSASRIAALWHSAWERAGRPAPPDAIATGPLRGSRKLILFSWDGGSSVHVQELLEAGKLPHLAQLAGSGFRAREVVPTAPTLTAPGHAALWTGTWSGKNGIVSNWMPQLPFAEHTLLELDRGFRSDRLRAEPIWAAAARQGLRAVVVQATHDFPFEPYGKGEQFGGDLMRNLILLNYFDQELAGEAVYERAARESFTIDVLGTALRVTPIDDPEDPASGFDTLRLEPPGAAPILLKPAPAMVDPLEHYSPAVMVRSGDREGGCYFRLFELSADASHLLLYRTRVYGLASSSERLGHALGERLGPVIGEDAFQAYEDGHLGPTLDQGGDGSAERRYLDTATLVVHTQAQLAMTALRGTDWDLLVLYLPYPDETLHRWHGYADPSVPGYDPALGPRFRELLEHAYRFADDLLGQVLAHRPPAAAVWVASDHGHLPAWKDFYVNELLHRAGLLGLDSEGGIDLARTRALGIDRFGVWLNTSQHKGGIVPPSERAALLDQVRELLLGAVDPQNGAKILARVYDVLAGERPELAGAPGPDLLLEPNPGYYPVSWPPASESIVQPSRLGGRHGFPYGGDRRLAAISYAAGPGIRPGTVLDSIRQIDVAPTAAALLGIGPPAQAEGRVLVEILEEVDQALQSH